MKQEHIQISFINPLSAAKSFSVVFGITGPIAGSVIYTSYRVLISFLQNVSDAGVNSGSPFKTSEDLFNAGSISHVSFVLIVLLFIFTGFFIGYVGALVYNWVSKLTGGVRVVIT